MFGQSDTDVLYQSACRVCGIQVEVDPAKIEKLSRYKCFITLSVHENLIDLTVLDTTAIFVAAPVGCEYPQFGTGYTHLAGID